MLPETILTIAGVIVALATMAVLLGSICAPLLFALVLTRALRGIPGGARVSRQSEPAAHEPDPAWPEDSLAFASLADLARQNQRPANRPTAPERRWPADRLVADLLHQVHADFQRQQAAGSPAIVQHDTGI